MRRIALSVIGVVLLIGMGRGWAHEAHEHGAGAGSETVAENTQQEEVLTGEVVDVFCYLSHGKGGLGKGHAGCAKKCIKNGLPVALKVGDQLYLAAMASHDPANKTLGQYAGEQITVHGQIMEQDGQHLIAITHIEETP